MKIIVKEELFIVDEDGSPLTQTPALLVQRLNEILGEKIEFQSAGRIALISGPYSDVVHLLDGVPLWRQQVDESVKYVARKAIHRNYKVISLGVPIEKVTKSVGDNTEENNHDAISWFLLGKDNLLAKKKSGEDGAIFDTNTTCGANFIVEIDSEQKFLIYRIMRLLAPIFLAMSCSSPLWLGRDTGLLSYRTVILRKLPCSGTPPLYYSEEEYLEDVRKLEVQLGTSADSQVFWDVLLPQNHDLIEMRICDAFNAPERTAVVGGFLYRILEHAIQDSSWIFRDFSEKQFVIECNKWEACRRGLSGRFLTQFNCEDFRLIIRNIADKVLTKGKDDTLLGGLREILDNGTDADRIRGAGG